MKMTRAEYLKARGWVHEVGKNDLRWFDPAHYGAWVGADDESASMAEPMAITIQLARDAEEERRAWVTFAAARLSVGEADPQFSSEGACALSPSMAAAHADAMLDLFRAKFAVEFTD